VEQNPTDGGRAPHENHLVLFQVKQDTVADYIAVIAAGSELLGSIDRELGKCIEAKVGDELECIRSLDVKIRHVVGLVKENTALAPGALFVAPVRVLGGDNRVDVGSDLRIAEHVHRIPGALEQSF
jgi:hypothetical protein